jgi:hypothetical protein
LPNPDPWAVNLKPDYNTLYGNGTYHIFVEKKVAVPFNEDTAFVSKTTLTAFKEKGVIHFYTSTHQCFNHIASFCHAVIVKKILPLYLCDSMTLA